MSGLREVLAASLRAEGIAENPAEFDSDIHSWRCSHPDIYGPCSCFREAVDDMTAAVLAWVRDRLASAEVREAVEQAENDVIVTHDMWIGDDGEPLDYLPERESQISNYLHEAATAALTAVREALTGHETRSGAPLADEQPEMAPGRPPGRRAAVRAGDGGVVSECRCGRPTRDAAYGCDNCGDDLARALGEVPWLDEQMEVTITRQQGIDYRRVGGGGAKKDNERPLPGNWAASEARTHLKALLVLWTRLCDEESVRSSDPRDGLPEDDLTAISRWLLWRVDGLMLHEAAGDAVEEITSAVAHCHRLIDKHPERQYLGQCSACEAGRLYARPGSSNAICDVCESSVDADTVRARLLAELDDRLCTAAEIARLSTYLGLKADRDTVRKRINQWNRRGQITEHPSVTDEVTFRFGEVYGLLAAAEYARQAG